MPDRGDGAMLRRRALLTGAAGASLLTITGCGIRLERDAPHIPGLKTAGPPADQAALQGLLDRASAARAAATADKSAWGPRLSAIHGQQATRLTEVMATQGMTARTGSAAPAGTGLLATEQAGAAALASVASVTASNLPMAVAVVVSQAAACRVLGKPAQFAGRVLPEQKVLLGVLPSLRTATYGFEVLAAKTPVKDRKDAAAALKIIAATRAAWEAAAGTAAPVEPPGYALPVQPTTPDNRRALARRLLTDVASAAASQVTDVRGRAPQLGGLAQVWSDAVGLAWQWGVAPTAFPRLSS
ncbi:DUF4439 domain-containing protein [Flexivirga sp. ID2601S]|uniref:DUF4439 domain-containing protein n=1 Tax=Flexivirga aerilata TaxID=1656889 RepID=A0A849ALG7_9MICO|nr:DUF4439 domain-containing protein [Flexivirga aerilata]NNG40366.1 DUF4439 domain-containing protein [Flexivirga aerilata]